MLEHWIVSTPCDPFLQLINPIASAASQLGSSDEEAEEEGKIFAGLDEVNTHLDDTLNVPDEQGRVLVNVNHPSSEPDIFLLPELARVIKPHQVRFALHFIHLCGRAQLSSKAGGAISLLCALFTTCSVAPGHCIPLRCICPVCGGARFASAGADFVCYGRAALPCLACVAIELAPAEADWLLSAFETCSFVIILLNACLTDWRRAYDVRCRHRESRHGGQGGRLWLRCVRAACVCGPPPCPSSIPSYAGALKIAVVATNVRAC